MTTHGRMAPEMERTLSALFPKMMARHAAIDCPKCEDGLRECIVVGSASETETYACDCLRGRERLTERNGDLESLGADKYDRGRDR